MPKITFDGGLCKGCGLCVVACPKKLIKISDKNSNDKGYFVAEMTDETKCSACASCATMCPDSVIEVKK